MTKDDLRLFGIKGIGDDQYYNNIEIFPGNMYVVCLTLDLSMICIKDSIIISFEGLDGFDKNGVVNVNIIPDKNKEEAITNSIQLRSETPIVFELFSEVAVSMDGENTKQVLEKRSTLILKRDQLEGKEEVQISVLLRDVPLRIRVEPEYTMLDVPDDPDEEELDLREGAKIMVKIKNKGDRIERDLFVLAILPSPVLVYKPGTTNIVRTENVLESINDSSSNLFNSSGLRIGDIRPSEEISVNFDVKLSDTLSSKDDKAYSVWISARTKTAGFWESKVYLEKMFMRRTYRFPFY